ncbi:interferon-induced, double-stranded RNA-activated protein kinase-like [Paroedura picta]|uniref:interferon-induced, double-stranded RNA-activated protein kinase-like n=1 Tax=Paroedura picta TaxID=143630 RepID=UPI004056DA06
MANKKNTLGDYLEEILAASKKKNDELLMTYKGVLYPGLLCSTETFEALEGLEARKDDVLIVAYPKCGTNWTLHILNEMVTAIPDNKDLPLLGRFQMLEFGPPEKVQNLKNHPSPRIFATHLYYDDIPKSFFEKKTKILVIFRNPKDAAVSYFHFYNKNPLLPTIPSWDEFFQKFMSSQVCFKSYFDHALVWDKHIDDENIKIITYEDMKENLYEEVKQIAEFYGFSLPDETIQSITEKATFKEMSNLSHETHGSFAPILFRKGAVGDWKTLFTEDQSKEVDAKFEECLAGTKLGAMLKYDKHCTCNQACTTALRSHTRSNPAILKHDFHFLLPWMTSAFVLVLVYPAGQRRNGRRERSFPEGEAPWSQPRGNETLFPGRSAAEERRVKRNCFGGQASKFPALALHRHTIMAVNQAVPRNYISNLHEYCQKKRLKLEYKDVNIEGPAHDHTFTVMVVIEEREYTPAKGKSKKEAKNRAAKLAWDTIHQEEEARSTPASLQQPGSAPHSTLPTPQSPQDAASLPDVTSSPCHNYISLLNEYALKNKVVVQYPLKNKIGEDHKPNFFCVCEIDNQIYGEGTGEKKQAAKFEAAKQAYENLMAQRAFRPEHSAASINMSLDGSQETSEVASRNGMDSESKSKATKVCVVQASPRDPAVKPKRKDTLLAPTFSKLHQRESQYTINERFLQQFVDIEKIDSGGFGSVFKAKHAIDKRVCAIKRVKLCFEEKELPAAEREVEALAKLDHINIVRYYDCWIGKDTMDEKRSLCDCLFIEMEFCEKGTLAKWIEQKRGTKKSKNDSLMKFQQIVEGVAYIHLEKLIHRDLKPLNILLSKEDKIKISDFGLVTTCVDDPSVQRTENRGTLSYMAPEQAGSIYGQEVDIFPLGLILFEMLYIFETYSEKGKEWTNIKKCIFPQTFNKEFPFEAALIKKMLSEEPHERPSSAEILKDLNQGAQDYRHTC